MATVPKVRQARLRASCDGCFLAKVKCSKARPVCSRCLSCGTLCNYSPSSRAGKPKPDNNNNPRPSTSNAMPPRSLMEETTVTYIQQPTPDRMFTPDVGWAMSSPVLETPVSRNPALEAKLALLGANESLHPPTSTLNHPDQMSAGADLYSGPMPWTPPTDMPCGPFPDVALAGTHMQGSHAQSQSFDTRSHSFDNAAMSTPPHWGDPGPSDVISYPQGQSSTSMWANCFPSPNAAPMIQPIIQPTLSFHPSLPDCACFAACLESLMALHQVMVQNPQLFGIVLYSNQKAVTACNNILMCPSCFARHGTDTLVMLIATILNKVTSVYKSATRHDAEVNLGAYQYQFHKERDWFRTEFLISELRKLNDLFVKFRDMYAEVINTPEFPNGLIDYIGRNVTSMLEAVQGKIEAAASASASAS